MPPDTPSAIFIAGRRRPRFLRSDPRLQNRCLRVFRENLAQGFARSLDREFRQFRNQPFHLARLDFILRDAAWFARNSVNHGWSAPLQLPGTPRRYEYIAIVAVKSLDQLHRSPLNHLTSLTASGP